MKSRFSESEFAINYDKACLHQDAQDKRNRHDYLKTFRDENKKVIILFFSYETCTETTKQVLYMQLFWKGCRDSRRADPGVDLGCLVSPQLEIKKCVRVWLIITQGGKLWNIMNFGCSKKMPINPSFMIVGLSRKKWMS